MKTYLKRVMKAVLNKPTTNKPVQKYSMEKNYIIHTDTIGRFAGKTAYVTGGSGEIGSAIATRLALEGATVYFGGRNKEKLRTIVDKLISDGYKARFSIIDVHDESSIHKAISDVIAEEGKIDIFVNCAGGSTRNSCSELIYQSTEMIDQMLEINLRGSMLCTREVGKSMLDNKYGRIINIASVIGEHGKPKFSDYAAAKAGIIGYTKSVAQELGKYGITVNCVSPGFIQRGEFTEKQLPYLLNSNFMHKVGSAADVASAVAYLASDEAGFITGQNLCVDGGRSLGLHGD